MRRRRLDDVHLASSVSEYVGTSLEPTALDAAPSSPGRERTLPPPISSAAIKGPQRHWRYAGPSLRPWQRNRGCLAGRGLLSAEDRWFRYPTLLAQDLQRFAQGGA